MDLLRRVILGLSEWAGMVLDHPLVGAVITGVVLVGGVLWAVR